jgi:3,4-dihydroxy 2-butanone 4-phosphate synthase / GTP cyclohydrolase II
MNEDGTMARVPDLIEFCKLHNLKMVTVADLIRYRMANERYVHRVAEGLLPTKYGEFRMISYESDIKTSGHDSGGGESHVALTFGDLSAAATDDNPILVRVHTHCLTGNVFGSTSCDCQATVDASLREIAKAGRGALIYLHHTQRGFNIDRSKHPAQLCVHHTDRTHTEKLGAPDQRILRNIGLGGQILSDLGIRKIRLLTNMPKHVPALQGFGIEIVERVPIALEPQTLTS